MARLTDNIKAHSNSNLVVSDDFNCRAAEVIWGRKNQLIQVTFNIRKATALVKIQQGSACLHQGQGQIAEHVPSTIMGRA